jgi:hypothetical protein
MRVARPSQAPDATVNEISVPSGAPLVYVAPPPELPVVPPLEAATAAGSVRETAMSAATTPRVVAVQFLTC